MFADTPVPNTLPIPIIVPDTLSVTPFPGQIVNTTQEVVPLQTATEQNYSLITLGVVAFVIYIILKSTR
jgi:hypothetical protein